MNKTKNPQKKLRIFRRFLIGFAIFITLVAIFYTEEDWRGMRAWKNCKTELAAQGIVLDWNQFIPPAVPDDQNFFEAPKIKEWFVGRNTTNDLYLRYSDKKFEMVTGSVGFRNLISTVAQAQEYLTWSDQFTPDFGLIREALKRPYARMNGDYSRPFEIPLPNFISVRIVAQILAQRSHSYLLIGQADKALREVTLLHDYRHLLEGVPTDKSMTLVAAMINVAVAGLYAQSVAEGLYSRQWSELQLIMLQDQLAEIHLLPFMIQSFQSEPAAVCRTAEIVEPRMIFNMSVIVSSSQKKINFWNQLKDLHTYLWNLVPRGWIYQNMVVVARSHQKIIGVFDSAGKLISPHKITEAMSEIEKSLQPSSAFNLLSNISTPNYTKALQTLAYNQTQVNEDQVVCALERYHLAHGEYPETLAVLAPQFMAQIPHDIINGQPLHYRRTADGQFVLYSVGWNEKDDGGKVALTKGVAVDSKNGDWVWQYSAK